jgi:hypothetical protein
MILHETTESLVNPKPFEEPAPDEVKGDLYIGRTPSGTPVYLSSENEGLERNILILGQSGYGKTITLKRLIETLYSKNIKFTAVDFLGAFEDIPQIYPNVIPVRVGRDHFTNIFNPPPSISISIEEWDNTLFGLHASEFGLMLGSHGFERDMQKELREIFQSSGDRHSPKDLELYLDYLFDSSRFKPATPQYRYLGVCRGRWKFFNEETRNAFAIQTGFMEKLRNYNVVFFLQGLSENTQAFVWHFVYFFDGLERLYNPPARKTLRELIMDECDSPFSINRARRYQENPPKSSGELKTARQLRTPMALATQSVEKLMGDVMLNTGTHIFFRIRARSDLFTISRSHMFTEEQLTELTQLDQGDAVIVLPSRYSKPFRIHIDYFDSASKIDPDIKSYNKGLLEKLKKDIIPQSRYLIGKLRKERDLSILSEDEENMLIDILKNPLVSITKRYSDLGFTTNRGKKVSRMLENKGFINILPTSLGRGGKIYLCELTEKGKNWLVKKGIKCKQTEGRGHLIHRFYVQNWASRFEAQGYTIKTEQKVGNAVADLLILNKEERYALEVAVESRPEQEIEKVKEYLRLGLGRVYIVSPDKNKLKQIKQKAKSSLSKEDFSKIEFLPAYACLRKSD